MRFRNLDTGEEYYVEEGGERELSSSSYLTGGAPSDATAEEASAQFAPVEAEAKTRGWMKGTKKLKTWAKSTLTAVREAKGRLEERLEGHHAPGGRGGGAASLAAQAAAVAARTWDAAPGVPPPFNPILAPARQDRSQDGSRASWDGASASGLQGPGLGPGPGPAQAGEAERSLAAQSVQSAAAASSGPGAGPASRSPSASGPASARPSPASAAAPSPSAALPISTAAREPGPGSGPRGYTAMAPLTAGIAAAAAALAQPGHERPGWLDPGPPPPRPAPAVPVPSQPPGGGPALGPLALGLAAAGGGRWAGAGSTAAAGGVTAGEVAGARDGGGGGREEDEAAGDESDSSPRRASLELREPLLAGGAAEPSSLALPAASSALNTSARLAASGRRAGGRQLQQVRLVQELPAGRGPTWAAAFSADARLLAAGGREGVVRVWGVYRAGAARPKLIAPAQPEPGAPAEPRPAAAGGPSADGSTPQPTSSSATNPPPRPSLSAPLPEPSPAALPVPAATGPRPRPPLLSASPLLELRGHAGDVLALAWSPGRLLLSAAADATARLWHVAEGGGGREREEGGEGGAGAGLAAAPPLGECLRVFAHPDFVTSVAWLPRDPARFVSGCADGKVRVWSVPDGAVLAAATVQQDMVTRVAVAAHHGSAAAPPPGHGAGGGVSHGAAGSGGALGLGLGVRVLAGTLRGKVRHYELVAAAAGPAGGAAAAAVALDYVSQVDVKRGRPGATPRKVTGLALLPPCAAPQGRAGAPQGPGQAAGENGGGGGGGDAPLRYVVTTADSRIRLYAGYNQERKFKGHRHTNTQIAAAVSPCGSHLACGSDDGWVYAWETGLGHAHAQGAAQGAGAGTAVGGGGAAAMPKLKEGAYEAFQTPEETTTVVLFAPEVCRRGRGLERRGGQPGGGPAGGGPTGGAPAGSGPLPEGPAGGPGPGCLAGCLLLVGGFSGTLRVYENLPAGWP